MRSSVAITMLAMLASFILPAAAAGNGTNSTSYFRWIGEVVPGKGNITLSGADIHDIIRQVNHINPKYMDRPVPRDDKPLLTKKEDVGLFCGVFATADKNNVRTMTTDIDRLGGYCQIASSKCVRLARPNTSGIYWCNDGSDVTVQCSLINGFAKDINNRRCSWPASRSKGISGQEFAGDRHWNMGIAYANCNHPPHADVPGEFHYPGDNGECKGPKIGGPPDS